MSWTYYLRCGHLLHHNDVYSGITEFPGDCETCQDKPITTPIFKPNNDPIIGIGGAPTRATTLPTEGSERKKFPVGTGVLDYFPDAIVAVAGVSYAGNEQHNPGQPLHWARGKSQDEADTMIRHYLQRGTLDNDGIRHSAKMAWRALAILQKEIEADQAKEKSNG